MKVLLDENLPRSLRHHLKPHDCVTVDFLGWTGTKNGKLLSLAEQNGFSCLVTLDDDLPPEQNIKNRHISVIILRPDSQGKSDLFNLAPKILSELESISPGQIIRVGSK